GGFGNNIFNPAAVGRAIVFATFMGATTDVITSATPTTIIASDFNWLVTNPEMIKDMMSEIGGIGKLLTGWYPGAIGETSAIIILLVGVVLS
ncbi:RnfABCDGE type electron transport complex subunit D, partial [[Clostridium] scindens]